MTECLVVDWLLIRCLDLLAQLLHRLILETGVSVQVDAEETLTVVDRPR